MASNTFDINLVVKKNYICSFYIDFTFMFVMFPRLCEKLCFSTIFRQLWTIPNFEFVRAITSLEHKDVSSCEV